MVDFPTYERALRHFVGTAADGTLTRVGWASTHAQPVPPAEAVASAPPDSKTAAEVAVASTSTHAPQAYGAAAPERVINLQIENIMMERTAFEVGEQIFLSATLSRASHMQCYLADATGTVIRLLPNAANPSGWVSANQAVRIPDWMSPNPGFIMDAAAPGTEGVACFATDEDRQAQLPEALRGPALKPITGYNRLEQINQVFAQALGADGYTGNAKYWQVVPRRPAPAQQASK